jgi:hypothetical protein
MLWDSLRYRIQTLVITRDHRQITKISDIVQRISTLKWLCAGHISRRTDNRWGKRLLEWRPNLGKHSVRRPHSRWIDDLRRMAGRRWMRVAEHPANKMSYWKGLFVVG